MQIKDLVHARELMDQGVLVPNKTILRDLNNHKRMFFGFTPNANHIILGDPTGTQANIWDNNGFLTKYFTIVKPKKKIKIDVYIGFDKKGNIVGATHGAQEDYFNGTNTIHIEHICKEIKVEDE